MDQRENGARGWVLVGCGVWGGVLEEADGGWAWGSWGSDWKGGAHCSWEVMCGSVSGDDDGLGTVSGLWLGGGEATVLIAGKSVAGLLGNFAWGHGRRARIC